jgi:hypothetical protein
MVEIGIPDVVMSCWSACSVGTTLPDPTPKRPTGAIKWQPAARTSLVARAPAAHPAMAIPEIAISSRLLNIAANLQITAHL